VFHHCELVAVFNDGDCCQLCVSTLMKEHATAAAADDDGGDDDDGDDYGAGVVACERGSYGANCEQNCTCENAAECDAVTGECRCIVGWTGARCTERCTAGTYGPNCSLMCDCQNGAGCDVVTGCCECAPGWYGKHCQLGQYSRFSCRNIIIIIVVVVVVVVVVLCWVHISWQHQRTTHITYIDNRPDVIPCVTRNTVKRCYLGDVLDADGGYDSAVLIW